jgi:2-oxoglutarate dehydrogenase E2 component (dihydrolipoamide succinyltransferase)
MGEGIIEATLISWMKNEGDAVSIDENLIEVATDKVNSEVPSTASGTLHKKLFNDNDVIAVGKPFAIISTGGDAAVSAPEVKIEKTEETKITPVIEEKVQTPSSIVENKTVESIKTDKFLSPLVQNIAKEEGLTTEDLEAIIGSGKEGRITKDDILAYIGAKTSTPRNETVSQPIIETKIEAPKVEVKEVVASNNAVNSNGDTNIVPMDRMRKLIADHMIKSIQTSAHVCSFIEADVTNMVAWRNKHKNGDPDQGPAFFMSKGSLVFLTDLWHLTKTIMIITYSCAIVFYEPIFNHLIDITLFWIYFGTIFTIFYDFILRKKFWNSITNLL